MQSFYLKTRSPTYTLWPLQWDRVLCHSTITSWSTLKYVYNFSLLTKGTIPNKHFSSNISGILRIKRRFKKLSNINNVKDHTHKNTENDQTIHWIYRTKTYYLNVWHLPIKVRCWGAPLTFSNLAEASTHSKIKERLIVLNHMEESFALGFY